MTTTGSSTTTVTEPNSLIRFALPQEGALVVQAPPISLATLVTAAESEAQAKDLLVKAAAPYGKNASTFGTRFLEQGGSIGLAACIGALVAVPMHLATAPNAAEYTREVLNPNGSVYARFHPVTRTYLHAAEMGAGVVTAGVAIVAACVAYAGLRQLKSYLQQRASQKTLDAAQLAPLAKLHEQSAEQPLARYLVGGAVAAGIPQLTSREVFVSRPATKLLQEIAGAAEGSEELMRQSALVKAMRQLEDAPAPKDSDVDTLLTAFGAMARAERGDLAPCMLTRLFKGAAPRNPNIPFEAGRRLHTALCEAAELG